MLNFATNSDYEQNSARHTVQYIAARSFMC